MFEVTNPGGKSKISVILWNYRPVGKIQPAPVVNGVKLTLDIGAPFTSAGIVEGARTNVKICVNRAEAIKIARDLLQSFALSVSGGMSPADASTALVYIAEPKKPTEPEKQHAEKKAAILEKLNRIQAALELLSSDGVDYGHVGDLVRLNDIADEFLQSIGIEGETK